ncbi:MAG: hypothetical protein QMD14_04615 [Candidatus Aenigmarchaeota archaeon]|nr:hypothetical protein [Candidatus Aenigmarchaeota archaeon]
MEYFETVGRIIFDQLWLMWNSIIQILKIFGSLAEVVSGAGLIGTLITFGIGFALIILITRLAVSNIKLLILIAIFYVIFATLISLFILS